MLTLSSPGNSNQHPKPRKGASTVSQQDYDDKILTSESLELKADLKHLFAVALTKRKVSLGGKETSERIDIQSAIRIIELRLRVLELEQPPIAKLLALMTEAPGHVVDAWLTVNKWLLLPRSAVHRAIRNRSQNPDPR